MSKSKLADATRRLAQTVARQHVESQSPTPGRVPVFFRSATYQGSETFDSDLSIIQTANGVTVRSVPRLAGAWTTPPSQGTVIAVLELGTGGYLIQGPILGNPLASPQIGAGG